MSLESLIKRFLWGGDEDIRKVHWVAWDKVTSPKKLGGLGLCRLGDINNAFLLKWLWRYRVEGDSLWRRVIDAIHGSARQWEMYPSKACISGTWSRLVKNCEKIKVGESCGINMVRGLVGNGLSIRFWLDPWVSSVPLKTLFPSLFRLEANKWCLVADKIGGHQGSGLGPWNWRALPSSAQELNELFDIHSLVATQSIEDRSDKWAWFDKGPVVFSVHEAKLWISKDRVGVPRDENIFKWCKWVPLKCNIFMWRLLLDRIPTKEALRRRNIIHGESACDFCSEEVESAVHVFTGCGLATGVWQGIASWVRLPPIFLFSIKDLLEVVKCSGWSKSRKEILYGIVMVTCWRIWKARNERIFSQKSRSVAELVADVKSLSYLWYCSRGKNGGVDWKGWKVFSFDVM
ncbi:putative reverse transcriptase zinc-binding domain-containing protein [Helianthus annuus]|nr:putative reverse transcriptase zinc-binding domain-containing protein [Helianthus annuus]